MTFPFAAVHRTDEGDDFFRPAVTVGPVRARYAAAAALIAFAVAGCGGNATHTYHVDGTAKCLTKAGYRVKTTNLGIVADSAPLGSLRAFQPGNAVTISFGNNHREARNVSELYRKFAPKKLRPHIDDVMEIQKNAVVLWTVTPPTADHEKVLGCLKG
jgi:hypothetical protein